LPAPLPPPQQQEVPQQMFAPAPPSEEAITMLCAMGFERSAVEAALRTCDNNVEVAANRLMG